MMLSCSGNCCASETASQTAGKTCVYMCKLSIEVQNPVGPFYRHYSFWFCCLYVCVGIVTGARNSLFQLTRGANGELLGIRRHIDNLGVSRNKRTQFEGVSVSARAIFVSSR